MALIAYLDRDGYVDADGSSVSLLDAFYYATVSVTTTGYGDIRPESDSARLLTTLLVTPARILFLIVLVGTTIEVLADRTRKEFLVDRWRKRLRDHVIVCGYGTKGRAAIRTLIARGTPADQIVVVDPNPEARATAQGHGLATVAGTGTDSDTLREAGIERAHSVIVAPDNDAAAVLMSLTAREHNANATIVAACREEENVHLLRQSGADSVILSSGAAGQLLGQAVNSPQVVAVLEDLLAVGAGLDIIEREVTAGEVGRALPELSNEDPVIAVIRDEEIIRFDDARLASLQAGDRLICLCSRAEG